MVKQYIDFLTPVDISEITGVKLDTLILYLNSYKFYKFELTQIPVKYRKFKLNIDFLNMLYTFLWYRGRVKEAEKLKNFFQNYNIECLKWEDFVC